MSAKMYVKSVKDKMNITPMSKEDLDNMILVLNLKIEQYPELKQLLMDTQDKFIYEDVSNRPYGNSIFWGGYWKGNEFIGENHLGKLWMEIRNNL